MMTLNEIRKKYIEFFINKGHTAVPSSSLLPENDPTTLFTGSGMQPMMPFLLGEKHPLGTRICDSQKCFRAQDVEEVGDNRHTTFFEMLGNWSFGDYFKKEQIEWIFEFLVNEIGLDPNRIYVSVFRGRKDLNIPQDQEAVQLWQNKFKEFGIDAKVVDFSEKNGLQDGRIFYYNEKNWWSRSGVPENMPVGEPGGPDSEMFWDFGADLKIHENSSYKDSPCHINCDCGRFMEISNNVFMSYLKTTKGYEPLPAKNIDFGGGLERVAAAANNNLDMFQIDVFKSMILTLEKLSHKKYDQNEETKKSFRVILDHLRAVTFLINDGALPSNKDQGYFTRRFIRRAVKFAHKIDIKDNFCAKLSECVINEYSNHYQDLLINKDKILNDLNKEETKFRNTLEKGLKIFDKIIQQSENKIISAKQAFDLFQSFGFPIELTIELAQEKGLKVDVLGFNSEFKKHQQMSRTGSQQKFKGGLGGYSEIHKKYHTATHLLHQALRQVLGNHVQQKGSNITEERLRFDFSHPQKLTEQEILQVQDLVNHQIAQKLEVKEDEMTLGNAKKYGAIGLFENKYGEKVKVYSIGEFSKEICGGPHVRNIADLGKFKIIKEEAVSSGIRRIKAILE